jgi:hypothetical protein
MLTLKFPYKTSIESKELLTKVIKQYNSVVHYAYNRFRDKLKQKEVRSLCTKLNNIDLLNSWLVQCAVLEGQGLFNYKLFI